MTGLREAMWVPMDEVVASAQIDAIADAATAAPVPRPRRAPRRTVVAATALGMALLGGAAFAAEGSVPGDALYPVKRLTEGVRSIFDRDVVAEHRVEELDEIVDRKRPDPEIDERLLIAETEVDRLPEDSVLRRELDRIRDRIATERDVPVTDLPRRDVPQPTTAPVDTTGDGATRDEPPPTQPPRDEPPPTTQPKDEPPPTTRPPRDEPPPTTQPPRDG